MSAEAEIKYMVEGPEFIDSLHRFLTKWYEDDWYIRWNVDDGYIELQMFVPSSPSVETNGYTVHSYGGGVNECLS